MATLGLQIILESVRQLIAKVFTFDFTNFFDSLLNYAVVLQKHVYIQSWSFHLYSCFPLNSLLFPFLQSGPKMDHKKEMWMIGIMVSVTIVKFFLMLYCRRFKNEIVGAYAQDHFFDVITNSVGLITAVLAVRFFWWIDPTGAIIVSLSLVTREMENHSLPYLMFLNNACLSWLRENCRYDRFLLYLQYNL